MLSNFIEVCNNKFDNLIVLSYKDGCIFINQGKTELAKWCYCSDLFYVTDGFDIIDSLVKPNQTLEIFNNDDGGDIVGKDNSQLLDKVYAKGGFIFIDYPKVDAVENAIDEKDKNVELTISNIYNNGGVYGSNEIVLPLYTFFSHLTNPENKTILNIPNYWKVKNTSNFDIQVKSLILYSKDVS